ncbi:MAG: D-alanyl-D-alanine carboxypeptidase/D-alanyl-D-alanine-endopeptidase [Gemmatimonadota bacterium]
MVLLLRRPGSRWAWALTALVFAAPSLLAQRPAEAESFVGPPASADLNTLRTNLARIIGDPALLRAHVGLIVLALESGEILFEHNAERRFTAASTSKLVTGAVGLSRLGGDYRWRTVVQAAGSIANGTLDGDLWVVGTGDPQFRRERLETVARSIRAAGITRIAGDLIGDDRAFAGAPWGRGWMWDDLYGSTAAGVSALQLSPARIAAEIRPGPVVGDPASMSISEPDLAPPIRNDVRTGAPGSDAKLEYVPDAVGGKVALRGWIPVDGGPVVLGLAPPHPTGYFLAQLERALEAAGIMVTGTTRQPDILENPGRIAWERSFNSAPLSEALGRMLKFSDNQIAETMLRTLGTIGGRGSAEDGLSVVESTLSSWGIEPDAFSLVDGSGMSRYSEIAPAALARLLRRTSQLPGFRVYLDALPIASVDGTLSRRFRSTAASRTVRAKTGSLAGVRGLAGYAEDGDGETLVFALLLNGYDSPNSVATALEDLLVEQLSLYHGPAYPEGREPPF